MSNGPGNGATPISRRSIREAIAAGLQAACPSAQAVYPYGISDFQSQWPVVRVMSRGSERPPITGAGMRSRFTFLVDVWVLFRDADAGWTEQNAEDALDALEGEIVSWLTGHQGGEVWTSIYYNGASTVDVVTIAGEPWLTEAIQVMAEVYG
jgi:hypothetical protein